MDNLRVKMPLRNSLAGVCALLWIGTPGLVLAADLTTESNQAFDKYAAQVEREFQPKLKSGELPVAGQAKNGDVVVAAANGSNPRDIGDAFIHDWVAGTFIPGVTLARVREVLKDFNRHKEYYRPEVIDSKLISSNGDEAHSMLRLRKKKYITVVLNTEYKTRFFHPSATRAGSISESTRISEVANPGEKDEKELPPGTGYGFLWRLNSYWALDERDGGVYVECRAVSLTRDIPTGLGWAIKPMIQSLPRESLAFTLEQTRKAAQSK